MPGMESINGFQFKHSPGRGDHIHEIEFAEIFEGNIDCDLALHIFHTGCQCVFVDIFIKQPAQFVVQGKHLGHNAVCHFGKLRLRKPHKFSAY